MRAFACGLMLLCGAASSYAQTLTDERLWANVTVQERTGTESPWRWYVEFQGRTREGLDTVDQAIVRPAVAYDLTSRSSVWFGHGYTPSYPAAGGELTENRVWQQYLWSGPALGSAVQVRTRFEQRWIEGADGVAWRFRQFVRLQKQVSARRALALIAWNEIFVHLNDTERTSQGFDQNRVFGGVGLSVARNARLELGYVNQAIQVPSGPDRRHHVLLVFVNATY
jgi:hypothetical protein